MFSRAQFQFLVNFRLTNMFFQTFIIAWITGFAWCQISEVSHWVFTEVSPRGRLTYSYYLNWFSVLQLPCRTVLCTECQLVMMVTNRVAVRLAWDTAYHNVLSRYQFQLTKISKYICWKHCEVEPLQYLAWQYLLLSMSVIVIFVLLCRSESLSQCSVSSQKAVLKQVHWKQSWKRYSRCKECLREM